MPSGGFRNRITKRRGGGDHTESPCEVDNIFLSDVERDTLKAALKPFIEGERDRSELASVIKNPNIFPRQILEKLEALREERDLRTVFVLHNLPEVKAEDFPKFPEQQQQLKLWLTKNTYAPLLIEGIFQRLDIKMDMGVILRKPDGPIIGSKLHKDNRPFAAISVVQSDGAATRVTDFASVLKDAQSDPYLQDFKIEVNGKSTTIADFSSHFPNWETQAQGIQIGITPGQSSKKEEALEALVAGHSVNLHLASGSIAFWGNKGRVFHQAMPTEQERSVEAGDFSRIAIAASPPRPHLR